MAFEGEVQVAADKVDPIHQFQLHPIIPIHIGGLDLSFTNSGLFMAIVVIVASAFLYFSTSNGALIPSRLQSLAEMAYEFIASMLRDSAGNISADPLLRGKIPRPGLGSPVVDTGTCAGAPATDIDGSIIG